MGCLKVVLQPAGLSVNFVVRTLFLKDNDCVRLGRIRKGEVEREDNALFNVKVVSSTHAFLSCKENKCFLEDKSRNGTFLNGLKMQTNLQYEIYNGDIIEMGMASFIVDVQVPGVLIDLKISILEEQWSLLTLSVPKLDESIASDENCKAIQADTSQTQPSSIVTFEANKNADDISSGVCDTKSTSELCLKYHHVQYKIPSADESFQKTDKTLNSTSETKLNDSSHPASSGSAFLEQLSLYFVPPTIEYNLENVYSHTLQRYQLLQIVAQCVGNQDSLTDVSYLKAFCSKLNEENSSFNNLGVENAFDGKVLPIDQVSHFCLRLACSRSFEASKWFIRQEVKLLCVKWELSSLQSKQNFLKQYNFSFDQVLPEGRQFYPDRDIGYNSDEVLFKVRFNEVPDLVRNRSVPIFRGWALLSHQQLIFAISNYYFKHLNSTLKMAKKRQAFIPYDSRLMPFFKQISEDILKKFFSFSLLPFERVTLKEINQRSKESFPLCMEVLYFYLVRNSHLKNGGRFQLNLFLKGIGLSLSDAIIFWRHFFLKKITYDEFEKKYLYFIRHGYGKLGKQADYPPLSCLKIMNSVSGPLEYHGCPFTTRHKEVIMSHLARHSVPKELGLEMWDLVQQGLAQTACGRLFDFKHNLESPSNPTDHPNIYYNRSRKLRKPIKITDQPNIAVDNLTKKCSCVKADVDW